MSNPVLQALPDGVKQTAGIRRYLAEAFALVKLDAAEIPLEDYSLTPYQLIVLGADLFEYDENDLTTAHDGVTVLVSQDGRRYKVENRVFIKYKVSDKDLVAQPASPDLGDAYLLTAAPTGADWASKAKNIATYTARGWVFQAPDLGDIVFVSDESSYYHYPVSGAWTAGLGDLGLTNHSIKTRHLQKYLGLVAEAEQNDPPVSLPGDGVAYIIGTAPTGDWLAYPGYIAISNGTIWEYFAPYEGALILDNALKYQKRYEAGIWIRIQTPPGMIDPVIIDIVEEAITIPTSTLTTVHTITITSNPQSALIFDLSEFTSDSLAGVASFYHLVQLVRDDEVTKIFENESGSKTSSVNGKVWIIPADSEPHDYKFQVLHVRPATNFQINLKAFVQVISAPVVTALDTGA